MLKYFHNFHKLLTSKLFWRSGMWLVFNTWILFTPNLEPLNLGILNLETWTNWTFEVCVLKLNLESKITKLNFGGININKNNVKNEIISKCRWSRPRRLLLYIRELTCQQIWRQSHGITANQKLFPISPLHGDYVLNTNC